MAYHDVNCDYEDETRGRKSRYNCGGFAAWDGPCGASDCSSCGGSEEEEEETEQVTETKTYAIARKDYSASIKKGDIIEVTSGFRFEIGGPRLAYQKPVRRFVAAPPGDPRHKAPNWERGLRLRKASLDFNRPGGRRA